MVAITKKLAKKKGRNAFFCTIMLGLVLFLAAKQIWGSSQFEGQADKSDGAAGEQHHHEVAVPKLELAAFANKPSSNSVCTTDSDFIAKYCESITCLEHKVEIEQETGKSRVKQGCKTLWFAGMHESKEDCRIDGNGYQNMYGAALNSAILNAGNSLQPVLMLGRLGLDSENSTVLSKFGSWAENTGAKVITVPRLSFQDVVDKHFSSAGPEHRQGPWLRMEIPRLIKEHRLFDMPNMNICKEHVLYTDVDVIFANKLTKANIKFLTNGLSSAGAVLSYGREYGKAPVTSNTGVMVINVKKFAKEIPGMIKLLDKKGNFGAYDQGLIKAYFGSKKKWFKRKLKRHVLPIHYNWKAYWKLEPSNFDQVKIIHFHGPKPGRGLEEIASCNITGVELLPVYKAYENLLNQGICCDRGRTATWAMDSLQKLIPAFEDIC
mmetsp:Transcript_3802/g.5817  ORF Transcript_3802/g.5817 Transcript_3802/m.5817 type:complete len:435 (+) Transcript_3802:62-1366(+)